MPLVPTTITGQNTHYRQAHARTADQYGRLIDRLDHSTQAVVGHVASSVQRSWRQDQTWARINGLGVALATHLAARLDTTASHSGRYITCERVRDSVRMRVTVCDSLSSFPGDAHAPRLYVEILDDESKDNAYHGVGYVDGQPNNHKALACWLGLILGGGLGHWAQATADVEADVDQIWIDLVGITDQEVLDREPEVLDAE